MNSFWRRSSITFRCELECWVRTKVGLAAGRYSGTSRPDLYRTPQALHNVLGPNGPVRHWGVFSDAQCEHLRIVPSDGEGSLFNFDLSVVQVSGSISGNDQLVLILALALVQVGAVERLLRTVRLENDESFGETVGAPASCWVVGKSVKESSTNLDSHSNSAASSLWH